MFGCGGVAIGVCLSHIIGDGTSATAFVNAWARTSLCGSQNVGRPTFDSAFYFPPSVSEMVSDLRRKIKVCIEEKIETRRLVFTKSKIAALKTVASSPEDSQVKNPTRVEAVSCFIWERAMAVYRANSHPKKVFGIFHAVNLRERMIPPLASHSFGNIYSSAYALSPIEVEEDYPVLVSHLRTAIKGIDAEYVEKLKNVGSFFESRKRLYEIHAQGELEIYSFSSWCRFPFYEVDFGWGKPTWACCPILPMKNVVILMNTRDGEGMEAWVNMLEEDMAIFENDPEILPYVGFIRNNIQQFGIGLKFMDLEFHRISFRIRNQDLEFGRISLRIQIPRGFAIPPDFDQNSHTGIEKLAGFHWEFSFRDLKFGRISLRDLDLKFGRITLRISNSADFLMNSHSMTCNSAGFHYEFSFQDLEFDWISFRDL
ncbi:hypothetical protein RJ641_014261 [Dillenia turbinata]|uniref:Vinorine synthase-like n=1 Tax=Dillenia turbinata TaxID=194707 RepID=A0AAN8Z4Q9_9MAGN